MDTPRETGSREKNLRGSASVISVYSVVNKKISLSLYSFRFKRTQKDCIESSLQSKKKSGSILNSILTPIFYSIVEALNAVFLGALEMERVY